MKKILALLTAAVVLAGFAACGKNKQPPVDETAAETEAVAETFTEESSGALPQLIINSEPYVVTAKDGFDNAGVTALVCGATANYSFTASSATTTWKVYLFDAPFTDGARYLPQAGTPALEGDGNLSIELGKYIYILCSESSLTAAAASDATLSIDYADASAAVTTASATSAALLTTAPATTKAATTKAAVTQAATTAATTAAATAATTAATTAAATEATTEAATAAQSTLPHLSGPVTVTAKDGFNNAGVTAFVCDAANTYSIKSSSANTTWKVYVLDQEFTDGARYLPQAKTPALEGDGNLALSAGQFVYVLCSESNLSAAEPTDASLSIGIAG